MPLDKRPPISGVLTTEVGYAVGWCLASEWGVAAVMMMSVDEGVVLGDALDFVGVGTGVGPFLAQGSVEPFDLPVKNW